MSRVPARLLRPLVQEFVGESEIPSMGGPLPRLTVLADKTNLHYDTIQHIWAGEEKTVEFEVADRILCAINAVQAWFREPLAEIYRNANSLGAIDPPKGRCQRRGCSNPLPPKTWPGGQPQKYCSRTCRDAASRSRLRDKTRVGRYSNPLDRCVNGHDWSTENTYISPGGKRLCRVCMRQRQAEIRRKARQAIAA